MSVRKQLRLSEAQVQELTRARDTHIKAHMRCKAAAILKVGQGASIRQVARSGLLKPVCPETVCLWIKRYEQDGLAGLQVQPGRGRKPIFSPSS